MQEALGDEGVLVRHAVEGDGQNERDRLGDEFGALDGEIPFEAEIALVAGLGGRGDDREKERAGADILFDLLVEIVAALEVALVEPQPSPSPRRIRPSRSTGKRGSLGEPSATARVISARLRVSEGRMRASPPSAA